MATQCKFPGLILRRRLAGSRQRRRAGRACTQTRASLTMPAMSRFFILLNVIAALAPASAVTALAAEVGLGNVQVINPWTRATPKGSQVAGAYMVIRNKGSEPERLVGGSSEVAGRVEVHKMEMEGGVAKMRPVEGGLEIKPGESVELKPGS